MRGDAVAVDNQPAQPWSVDLRTLLRSSPTTCPMAFQRAENEAKRRQG